MKITKKIYIGYSIVLALLFASQPNYGQSTLAFPGAEGFGRYTTGGRGGLVIEVTNLKDQDRYGRTEQGSFRAALETTGTYPITIVFKVSGIIELSSELKSSRSNVTIAGQTAPGDGICIKDASVKLSGDNLIIRYMRFRPGDETKAQVSCLNIENTNNIIVDHCSFSWSIEENMGMYDNHNTTVQWSILSESLYDSYHSKGARGYAAQWGGQKASYHHNLIACHNSRSPRVNGSKSNDTVSLCDYRNNIIYNYAKSNSIYGGDQHLFWDADDDGNNDAGCFVNFVNNYLKPGPAYSGEGFLRPSGTVNTDSVGYAEWYINGNTIEGYSNVTADNWLGVDGSEVEGIENIKVTVEHDIEGNTTTHSAEEAYQLILKDVGATLPIIDPVDQRVLKYVTGELQVTGTGIIDSQTEVGGWPEYNTPIADSIPADTDKDGMPDTWEVEHSLNPNDSTDGSDITDDGYSNLEHYLNSDIPYITPTQTTSVNVEKLGSGIQVYPTFVESYLTIASNNKLQNIKIMGVDGKEYLNLKPSNTEEQINVGKLAPGTYFIQIIEEGKKVTTQRFIKQ